jgi:sodium transport system permease protein
MLLGPRVFLPLGDAPLTHCLNCILPTKSLTFCRRLGYSCAIANWTMTGLFRFADIRILYLRELRSALRERNIVVNGILLPIFLYPVLLWLIYTGITFVGGQTEGFSSRIVLRNLPQAHTELQQEFSSDSRIDLRDSPNPVTALRDGTIDLLAEFSQAEGATAAMEGNFQVRLTYDNSKDRSGIARDRCNEILTRYRDQYLERNAGTLGISPAQLQLFWIETQNVATSRQMGQFILGLVLPLFLIIMVAVGCMFPAIDSTAGEREKSTWETSMTLATGRANIVAAKYLYVTTMAALAGILNVTAMMLSMRSIMAPLMEGRSEDLTFRIPLYSLPLILLLILLLAAFVSAGMMIFASFARTFREGQAMASPFYIAIFLPALFLQSPDIQFTMGLALIPVVNVVMVFREAISGTFHWPLIGISFAIEFLCVALALGLAAAILRYEDFIIGSYGGNFAKFLKERLLGGKRRGRQ